MAEEVGNVNGQPTATQMTIEDVIALRQKINAGYKASEEELRRVVDYLRGSRISAVGKPKKEKAAKGKTLTGDDLLAMFN